MQRSNTTVAILIIGVLFFIFGFVTWLNGPLIPFMRIACELSDFEASIVVPFAFYVSYFVMALPSSVVLRRIGMKNGMMFGEVVVFFDRALARGFEFRRKQAMQLGSKMRFMAAQLTALGVNLLVVVPNLSLIHISEPTRPY